MKILLDNCVHVKTAGMFVGHDVRHCRDMGWRGLTNGTLLAEAARAGFGVFVTTDKKIRHEQNLRTLPIPVVELDTRYTRFSDLQSLAPHVEAALAATRGARFVSVGADGKLDQVRSE